MTLQNDMTQCENNLSTQIDDTMNTVFVDRGNEPSQLESEMNTTLVAPDSNTWEVMEVSDIYRSIGQTQNVSAKGDTLDRVSSIPIAQSVNRNHRKNKPPKFLIPIIVLASIAAVSSIFIALVIKRGVFSDSCNSSKATISGSCTDANKSGNVGNQRSTPTVTLAETHSNPSTEESEERVFFSSKKTSSQKPLDPMTSTVSQKVPNKSIDSAGKNLPSTLTQNSTQTPLNPSTDESEERVYFSSNKTSSQNTPDPMSSTVSQKVPSKSIDSAAGNLSSELAENFTETPLNPSTEESEERVFFSSKKTSSQKPPNPSNSTVSQNLPNESIDNAAENLPSTLTQTYTVTTPDRFTDESEKRVYISSNKTSSQNTPDPMGSTVSQKVPSKSIDSAAGNLPSELAENIKERAFNPSIEESDGKALISQTAMSSRVPQKSLTEQSAYNPLKPSSDDGQLNHELYWRARTIGMEKFVITREGNGFIPELSDDVLVVMKKFGEIYDTDTFSRLADKMAAVKIIQDVIFGRRSTAFDMRFLLPVARFDPSFGKTVARIIKSVTTTHLSLIWSRKEIAIVKMRRDFLLNQLSELLGMYETNPILLDLEKIRRAQFTDKGSGNARMNFNNLFTPVKQGVPGISRERASLFNYGNMSVEILLREEYFCSGRSGDKKKVVDTMENQIEGNGKSENQSLYGPEVLFPSKFFDNLRSLDPRCIKQLSGNPLRQLKLSDPKYENDWNAILRTLDQFCEAAINFGDIQMRYSNARWQLLPSPNLTFND